MNSEQPQHSVENVQSSPRVGSNLFEANFRGRPVVAADGQAVGRVADLIVDTETWRVESVQLKLNNAIADKLGIRRGRFHAGTIELPVHMVQSVGDHVVLTVPIAALRPRLSGPTDVAA
jgi:sporulation protein YlmC with PRC-barrel domain